jgi:hypothetical protein
MGGHSEGEHSPEKRVSNETPAITPANGQRENKVNAPAGGTPHVPSGLSSVETSGEKVYSRPSLLNRLTGTRTRRALLSGVGVVITGALAAIIGGLALGWFSGPETPDVTQQILFQPWSTSGTGVLPDVHIASQHSGYCWIHSVVTSRPDAYRCVYESKLLDPCIANPNGGINANQVICTYPSPSSVTLISLTKALPTSSRWPPGAPPNPWLLILADGEQCFGVAEASTPTAGLGHSYECGTAVLYGTINRTGQLWKIYEQHNGDSSIILAPIAKAYFL